MAFNQVATGISIINTGHPGSIALSLTNFTTSATSNIAAGSAVEISNAYFLADSDVTPNASSWTAITTATTAYLALTPSGTAGSQIITASWVSTLPSWDTAKQGWYTTAPSTIRVVASAYKGGTSSYWQKRLINYGQSDNFAIGTIQMFDGLGWVDNITIPGWYSCVTANSIYGCPALTDRFIMGALTPGATGGNNSVTQVLTHNHGISDPAHAHIVYSGGGGNKARGVGSDGTSGGAATVAAYTGITIDNAGVAAPDNRPAYYTVIYIRKCY